MTAIPADETARRRVLVLDARDGKSLAACRALGRRHFEVGVAGYGRGRLRVGAAASSRFVTRWHVLPDPAGPADAFASGLRRLVDRYGYEVIVATADLTLARLASIELPAPSFPEVGASFRRLTDKVGLQQVCEQAGVAYPATCELPDDDAARRAADELGLPVFVKGARSAEAGTDGTREARGARRCARPKDVVAAARGLREAGVRPIAQRAVRFSEKLNAAVIRGGPGGGYRYAHAVLREAPTTGGIGVTLETISPWEGRGAEAADVLERVCDAAGYRGLAQAELYRSADDGRLYLLDVNPRLWGSTWFAELLGQRIVERGVRFALGLPPLEPTPYPAGRRFHSTSGELRWLSEQPSRLRGALELIRTTRPSDRFDQLDPADPMPLAVRLLAAIQGLTSLHRRG